MAPKYASDMIDNELYGKVLPSTNMVSNTEFELALKEMKLRRQGAKRKR